MTQTIGQLPVTTSVVGADQMEVEIASGNASRRITFANLIAALTGLTDHGGLLGLADNDHPQYALAAGQVFSGNVRVPRLEVDDASHYLDTDAAGALQLMSLRASLADNATLVVGAGNEIKLVFILDTSNGNVGLFFLRGGVNSTQEVFDPSSVFSTTKDTATSFNVYYESGSYYLQNKRGGARLIGLFALIA